MLDKIVNGHGIRTSQFSVTNIGYNNYDKPSLLAQRKRDKEAYMQEFKVVNQAVKEIHIPSTKDLHMSVNYKSTLEKLSLCEERKAKTPHCLTSIQGPEGQQLRPFKLSELDTNSNTSLKKKKENAAPNLRSKGQENHRLATIDSYEYERTFGWRKHYKERASQSKIDQILKFNKNEKKRAANDVERESKPSVLSKKPQTPLYPSTKCQHNVLLGLDGKLKGNHPDSYAPYEKDNKKDQKVWRGLAKGWMSPTAANKDKCLARLGEASLLSKSEGWPNNSIQIPSGNRGSFSSS